MTLKEDQWVWVFVGDPEGDARFMGLQDLEESESIIPAYMNKKAAEAGFDGLDKDVGVAFEVQAIRFGDLCRRAGEGRFSVAVINDDGEIVEKKGP